jgi:dTMP kinase
LYAADRYHHVEAEIRPLMKSGHIVISDRYIASGLVIQRFDHVDPGFLWQLNEKTKQPDLAVILEADPDVIAQRLNERGPHNRFQLAPGSSHRKVEYYRQATETLATAGFDVLRVDCSNRPAEQSAALIRDRLTALLAPVEVVS